MNLTLVFQPMTRRLPPIRLSPAAQAAEWGGEEAGTVIALKIEPSIKVLSFCLGKLASRGE